MTENQPNPLPIETPMERIFRKVMGRKMTTREKILFHLDGSQKPLRRNNSNRSASTEREGAKLTRN